MIMKGVVPTIVSDMMTAEAFLSLSLAVFGAVSVGIFVVMWIRGELSD